MKDILYTLLEALGLVVLVVFIFLQGWRATLIPLLAVPVSLVGTFIVFPHSGLFHQHAFAVRAGAGDRPGGGRCDRGGGSRGTNIEEGMAPRDAALKAMQEVSGPVIAIALILTAVFVPTIFIPGITGRLYQQFAVTIAISVIFSAFNALSLSPALAAMLLKPRVASAACWRDSSAFNHAFGRATEGYVSLSPVLIHKAVFSLVLLAAIGGVAVWVGGKLPTSFLPEEDYGYVT